MPIISRIPTTPRIAPRRAPNIVVSTIATGNRVITPPPPPPIIYNTLLYLGGN
jgi:hypothetical protein